METMNEPVRDARLWRIARKRAAFKRHFMVYLMVNAFLWCLWFFPGNEGDHSGLPWPVWPTFGWGIGILFEYLGAYRFAGIHSTEKEYQKLLQQQNK